MLLLMSMLHVWFTCGLDQTTRILQVDWVGVNLPMGYKSRSY
jgi:hypothetical protein